MKTILLIIFISASIQTGYAQYVNFDWAKKMGGAGNDGGKAVAVDASGNVFTLGVFENTADFDSGPGIFNMTSAGDSDIYVSKFNAAGNFIWAKQFGGSLNQIGTAITVDQAGNVYITGFFWGTIDLDPGPATLNFTAGGHHDMFVCKLNAAGNLVWAKQMKGTLSGLIVDSKAESYSIAVDASGNVFTTGSFSGGTIDFDPGPAVFNLSTFISAEETDDDIFISKLDASGNFILAKKIGSERTEQVSTAMSIDAFGNICLTGYFEGTVDFDPGAGAYNLTSTFCDPFVCKLDHDCNFIWAKQFAGNSEFAVSPLISSDPSGNIIVSGRFFSTTDFDPGPAVFTLDCDAGSLFICKLDPAGNFTWAKQIGNQPWLADYVAGIIADAYGNIYLAGSFTHSADFDPGPPLNILTTAGVQDIYILKLNAAGNFAWIKQFTSISATEYQEVDGIAIDPSGNVYITGYFDETTDFDPGTGNYNLMANGGEDIFVVKLIPCINSSTANITASACNSYTLNSETYTSGGTYTQSITNTAGCDSLIVLTLTLNSTSSTSNVIACDTYSLNGHTYTSSGVYMDTLINTNGCDSIITLNLIINSKTSSTINAAICDGDNYLGYTTAGTYIDTLTNANGCDSVRTIYLVMNSKTFSENNAVICPGENYWGHTSAGTYRDTLVNTNGCDSIRTLNLSFNAATFSISNAEVCPDEIYWGHSGPGIFKDTLINSNGCDSIRTLNLSLKNNCIPFFIPTAFTPNADSRNDIFKPTVHQAIGEYLMLIYNIYGQQVFESSNYLLGWDGTFKGQQQPTGTYVYYIHYRESGNSLKEVTGSLVLIR